jgi:hypothetical protein
MLGMLEMLEILGTDPKLGSVPNISPKISTP